MREPFSSSQASPSDGSCSRGSSDGSCAGCGSARRSCRPSQWQSRSYSSAPTTSTFVTTRRWSRDRCRTPRKQPRRRPMQHPRRSGQFVSAAAGWKASATPPAAKPRSFVNPDGSHVVRFSNFDIEGSPDPIVYVVQGENRENPGGGTWPTARKHRYGLRLRRAVGHPARAGLDRPGVVPRLRGSDRERHPGRGMTTRPAGRSRVRNKA